MRVESLRVNISNMVKGMPFVKKLPDRSVQTEDQAADLRCYILPYNGEEHA